MTATCANRENVGVEDNVLWVESNLLHKNLESTLAHRHLLFFICCLPIFVERHHNNSGPIAFDQFCLLKG